ncbi:DNA-processing protein DprA [uncultured Parasutterella sp.]|uniref:DNA-processing protein DprA n=1 Tax=uncultured Parasutterella sp. TaxID=1263098 RepID=UPI0025EF5096|nr:DNA-processing protein DprA [uncultured Parasutterella sp.]
MALTTTQILSLLQLKGVGRKSILKISERLGPTQVKNEELFNCLSSSIREKNKENISEALFCKSEEILSCSEKLGIKALSYFDEQFPDCLRIALDESGRPQPPMIIFYKGNVSLLSQQSIAIIGRRNPSDLAQKISYNLAKSIAEEGLCVVSGLAEGCDTYAHLGALSANKGKTVAILAHGLDMVYPKTNALLAQRIVDNQGLLISEYPLYTLPTKYSFVDRDRLQSALALATVVVETEIEGGSFHAARACLKANKRLFTIDGPYSPANCSAGSKELVKEGGKLLSVNDVAKDSKVIIEGILSSSEECNQGELDLFQ